MSGWLGDLEGELGYRLWKLAWCKSFMPWATDEARVVLPDPGMPAMAMRIRSEAEADCSFSSNVLELCYS